MTHPIRMPRSPALPLVLAFGLGACSLFAPKAPPPLALAAPDPAAALAVNPMATLGTGVSVDSLDASQAEEAAALAALPVSGEHEIGRVTVALGSPTEPGFWLKSALISVPGKGRVEVSSGKSVAVDLIPGEGAALLSFAAFRALDLSLTDLPDVTVFSD